MTPLQREALQMCLEYIETDAHERRHVRWKIQEALAEPQQEPVAWMHTNAIGYVYFRKNPQDKTLNPVPLYTSPPAQEFVCSTGLCHYRKPLTNLEGLKLACKHHWLASLTLRDAYILGIRDAEAAHGIKENT